MKKGIKYGLAVLGVVIVGVGVGWASGSPKGIHVSDGAKYQYQLIDPEDIIIEYSGLKPDMKLSKYKDKYVSDTTAYLTDSVGVYLGDNHFEAKVPEFVKYSDINWKWNISNVELYNLMVSQGSVNTEFFEGTIDYADGMQGNVKADSVNLRAEEGKMVVEVEFRGKKFPYKVEIKDNWGDGESLSEEQLEQLKQEEQEQGSEVVDVNKTRFSLEDAPELTNVDWDLFNSIYSEEFGDAGFNKRKDLFKVVGADLRVNFEEFNKDYFLTYYGNTKEGIYKFCSDIVDTYDGCGGVVEESAWCSPMCLEPYNTNTELGLYEDLKNSFYERFDSYNEVGWWSEDDYQINQFINFVYGYNNGEFILEPYDSTMVSITGRSIVGSFLMSFDLSVDSNWDFLYNNLSAYDRRIKEWYPNDYSDYYSKVVEAVDSVFIEHGYVDENGNATMHYSDFLR